MKTKTKTKTKMGRPPMPSGTAKGVLFAFRVAQIEADKIYQAIKKSGMPKPEWARRALLSAAEA